MNKPLLLPKILMIIIFLGSTLSANAQTKEIPTRNLEAKKTNLPVVIDGILDDKAWEQAAEMNDFTEFRPNPGDKDSFENRTVAYLMYNNEGIYFGGHCYEANPANITKELVGRDGFGSNDYIGLIFDTYLDHINGFEYFVTPLGEQWDAKMSPGGNNNGGEDFGWNSVWKASAKIHDKGWDFEMFIPLSAIRFGKAKIQDWGLNVTRRRRLTEEQNVWNPIDVNKNGFLTQEGIWKGVQDIKPPIRLQLSPYFSTYVNHYKTNTVGQKDWTNQINGGLDLKYGINQAFTLDAILIPDFGQVQSDNQVLNLTPFEVQYNEYRAFFSEGTELFSKGDLFYSRRIGGTPLHLYEVADQLKSNERVLKNPSESRLINGSKISGRTQSGLGIGFLNAIAKPQHAIIEDQETHQTRNWETNPLTNYNIIVLDQTLKNNSSVSFINTSVVRNGKDYDSNVSGALFDLNDKKNTWNVNGKLAMSKYSGVENPEKMGINTNLGFGKISGKFNFRLNQSYADTRYSHNDLGYFTNNNYLDHYLYMGYRITEPKGWYNRMNFNFNMNLSYLAKPIQDLDKTFQSGRVNINVNTQTKKLFNIGFFTNATLPQNDFYEPRKEGYFLRRNASLLFGAWFETNSAKKYSFGTENLTRQFFNFYGNRIYEFNIFHTYRFNSKFSISHNVSLEPRRNSIGYAATSETNEVIMARRKINTISNVLNTKYRVSNKMGVTFRARHYTSAVRHDEFFTLRKDGHLNKNSSFKTNVNRNVNIFNIDMVYTWEFAPGSFLNLVWKDASYTEMNDLDFGYLSNLDGVLSSPQTNNLSLKVIYFFDYLQLKKKAKNK